MVAVTDRELLIQLLVYGRMFEKRKLKVNINSGMQVNISVFTYIGARVSSDGV